MLNDNLNMCKITLLLLLGLILSLPKKSIAQVNPIYYTIGDDVVEKIDSLISSFSESITSYYGIWDMQGEITYLMLARIATMQKCVAELLKIPIDSLELMRTKIYQSY